MVSDAGCQAKDWCWSAMAFVCADELTDWTGDPATVVRTVYKTMAPTFKGPVAGYSTLREDNSPPPSQAPKQEVVPTTTRKPEPKTTSASTSREAKTVSSMPTAIHGPNKSISTSLDSVLAKATGEASVSSTVDLAPIQPSTSQVVPSSIATADPSKGDGSADSGTSAGAKAGIAFGVLGGVLLVGLLVFFLFNRRRKQAAERQQLDSDDEKLHGAMGAGRTPFEPTSNRSDPKAPRISLRPVTQFLPNWNGFDKRASKGAALSLAPAAAAATARAPGGSAWDRPSTSQSTNPANPFGNQAERVPEPIAEEQSFSRPTSPPAAVNEKSPAFAGAPAQDPLTANGPAIAAGAVAGTAAAAGIGAAAMSRKTSMRRGGPKNVDLTLPPNPAMAPTSPAGTEFSITSVSPGYAPPPSNGAAAIAAAGGPQNSSVHRVQLDFKPTLEDEMQLRSGELVRLLHEYDDGWVSVKER